MRLDLFRLPSTIRALARSRGFTVAVILTLGAAIALQTAVVAVLNAYAFRGLPYPESERLHWVRFGAPGQDWPRGLETVDWRPLDALAEHAISWDLDVFYLLGQEYPERAPGAWITPSFA